MNIRHLGSVILAVSDLEKSTKFYHEVIGLPIKNKHGNWVELAKEGATVILHPASKQINTGTSIENGIVIGLIVGDMDSAVKELKSKNVTVYREVESHKAGKNCIVLDPDKYMISLFEPSFDDGAKQARGFHGFAPL
ncbi:Glyoxalase/bleomycin resistance protein/dioxygenase [Nitrosotalea sinensis]|jgi:lactoylglutathione lyase|uniref:Glyoxalase/bleomycin resistance protein/dioxygenase n=1 Tax=Nitrosotalea sinensis TaxID=1499975 RepID=A0A2H1EI21_9ARCH|nr:VOC family protein [Candidatus Nitrosotalea sinensis]SHO46538.1 Glyoxalase/bleomycin resistance protein/dioxygenase [Candidatus Nitrosotalea sinensis]